jgi:hypothetical protein
MANELKMSPIPDYGDHMIIGEFIECVRSGFFIDDDGIGRYATKTEMTDKYISPSDVAHGKVDWRFTHVVWFNK